MLRAGMVPARTWRVHAVGMAPTGRFEWRRQMAAAAGKKRKTAMSLFMEAFGLEVEEDVSAQNGYGLENGQWNKKWPLG